MSSFSGNPNRFSSFVPGGTSHSSSFSITSTPFIPGKRAQEEQPKTSPQPVSSYQPQVQQPQQPQQFQQQHYFYSQQPQPVTSQYYPYKQQSMNYSPQSQYYFQPPPQPQSQPRFVPPIQEQPPQQINFQQQSRQPLQKVVTIKLQTQPLQTSSPQKYNTQEQQQKPKEKHKQSDILQRILSNIQKTDNKIHYRLKSLKSLVSFVEDNTTQNGNVPLSEQMGLSAMVPMFMPVLLTVMEDQNKSVRMEAVQCAGNIATLASKNCILNTINVWIMDSLREAAKESDALYKISKAEGADTIGTERRQERLLLAFSSMLKILERDEDKRTISTYAMAIIEAVHIVITSAHNYPTIVACANVLSNMHHIGSEKESQDIMKYLIHWATTATADFLMEALWDAFMVFGVTYWTTYEKDVPEGLRQLSRVVTILAHKQGGLACSRKYIMLIRRLLREVKGPVPDAALAWASKKLCNAFRPGKAGFSEDSDVVHSFHNDLFALITVVNEHITSVDAVYAQCRLASSSATEAQAATALNGVLQALIAHSDALEDEPKILQFVEDTVKNLSGEEPHRVAQKIWKHLVSKSGKISVLVQNEIFAILERESPKSSDICYAVSLLMEAPKEFHSSILGRLTLGENIRRIFSTGDIAGFYIFSAVEKLSIGAEPKAISRGVISFLDEVLSSARLFTLRVKTLELVEQLLRRSEEVALCLAPLHHAIASRAVRDPEPKVRVVAFKALRALPFKALSTADVSVIYANAVSKSGGDPDKLVRDEALKLFTKMSSLVPSLIGPYMSSDFGALCEMPKEETRHEFGKESFAAFIGYIEGNCTDEDTIFRISARDSKISGGLLMTSDVVMVHSVVWEAAKFCVDSQLQTHLGGPEDTLTALKAVLTKLQEPKYSRRTAVVFLEFIEALEKTTQNACEVNSGGIPPPSNDPSAEFFIINKDVVRMWFSDVRAARIKLAMKGGSAAHVIRLAHRLILPRPPISPGESPAAVKETWLLRLGSTIAAMGDKDVVEGMANLKENSEVAWLASLSELAQWNLEGALDRASTTALAIQERSPVKSFFMAQAREWTFRLGEAAGIFWEDACERGDLKGAQNFLAATKSGLFGDGLLDHSLLHIVTSPRSSESDAAARSTIENARAKIVQDMESFHGVVSCYDAQRQGTQLFMLELAESFIAGNYERTNELLADTTLASASSVMGLRRIVALAAGMHLACPDRVPFPYVPLFNLAKIFRKNSLNLNFASRALECASRGLSGSSIGTLEKMKLELRSGKITYSDAIEKAQTTFFSSKEKWDGLMACAKEHTPNLVSVLDLAVAGKHPLGIVDHGVDQTVITALGGWFIGDSAMEVAGQLDFLVTASEPVNARNWLHLGNWCYEQAQKKLRELFKDGLANKPGELEEIRGMLGGLKDNNTADEVIEEIIGNLEKSEKYSDPSNLHYNEHIEQLKKLFLKQAHGSKEDLSKFLDTCDEIRKHFLELYGATAVCLFKYFKLMGKESVSVTYPLRILRIFVRYGHLFEKIFAEGFASTPLHMWKALIPQLFARLGHHSKFVYEQLSQLLIKLSEKYPDDVLFPVISGETKEQKEAQTIKTVAADMKSRNPTRFSSARKVVSDLLRVAVLWEEEWIELLQLSITKLTAKFIKIREDLKKKESQSQDVVKWIEDCYRNDVQSIIASFESLIEKNRSKAETQNEQNFKRNYLPKVVEVLNVLKKLQPLKRESCIAPMKKLLTTLVQDFKPGTRKLSQLSTVLRTLRDFDVPVPGLQQPAASKTVTLASFMDEVIVFASKTKPKKISAIGSDGRVYSYLLKGREDLKLDDRIMQFLSTVNYIFQENKDETSHDLHARTYSVVPLGKKSGLIQWVDKAPPIFDIYKQWQIATTPSSRHNQQLPRPVDNFYAKLFPLLKKNGIAVSSSKTRRPDILLSVFKSLAREAPKHLLAQSFWCSSVTASSWWKKITTYNKSVATMSIIGYIIGLGDRHLDNILIDFSSGDIVHVDYNVCFEKGLLLRIPERVPFRLTQNMENALGFTKTEGVFKNTCVRVLSTLRNSSETLLTLLESFIFDPLVDWDAKIYKDDETRNEDELETMLKQVVERERDSCRSFREIAEDFSATFSRQNRQKNSAAIILELEKKSLEIQHSIDSFDRALKGMPKILEESDAKISLLNTKKKQADERINQLTHDIDKAEKDNMQHRDFHMRAIQRLSTMNFEDAETSVQKYLVLDTKIDPALESQISNINVLIAVYHDHASKCLAEAKAFAEKAAQKSQDCFACFCWGNVFKTLFHDPSTANDGLLRQNNIYKFINRKEVAEVGICSGLEKMKEVWDEINAGFAVLKKMRDEILAQYEESINVILTNLPLMNAFKKYVSQQEEAQEELSKYNSFVIEACSIVKGIHGCEDPLNSGSEESNTRFQVNKALFNHVVECVNEADSILQEIDKEIDNKVQKQRKADALKEMKEKHAQNYANINELLDKQKSSGSNSSLVIQTQAGILISDSVNLINDVEGTINGLVSITQDTARLRSVRRVAINNIGLIGTLRKNVEMIDNMIKNSEDINDTVVEAVISGLNELCKELTHLSKMCSQKLEFIFGTTSEDSLKSLRYEEEEEEGDSSDEENSDEDGDDEDDYSDESEDSEEEEEASDRVEPTEDEDKARKKSAHAINVLNRVKEKLEGKDGNLLSLSSSLSSSSSSLSSSSSSNERMSVTEQVNNVIALARSPENLSMMFEGWTAWI